MAAWRQRGHTTTRSAFFCSPPYKNTKQWLHFQKFTTFSKVHHSSSVVFRSPHAHAHTPRIADTTTSSAASKASRPSRPPPPPITTTAKHCVQLLIVPNVGRVVFSCAKTYQVLKYLDFRRTPHLYINESVGQVERGCPGFPRHFKVVGGRHGPGYAAAPPSDCLVLQWKQPPQDTRAATDPAAEAVPRGAVDGGRTGKSETTQTK